MLENFSEQALRAVMLAQEEARRSYSALVHPDHVFLGLLRDSDNAACELLYSKQIDPSRIHASLQLEIQPRRNIMDIAYSEEVQLIFRLAENEAQAFGLQQVDTDHLLLGLVETGEGQGPILLTQSGLNLSHLRWNMLRLRYIKKNQAIRAANLDRFSLDLTARLEQGLLPTVVEWEPMVERLIQYLGMQQKHNTLLVGEHGVGKTALIHALNQYILDSRIFQQFAHCRVVFLYVDKMLAEAGTSDEKLYEVTKSIMSEIRQSGDIILVIENIHQLFLAQKKELEFIITQQLLTLLEEKEIFCIATTTPHFLKVLEDKTIIRHLFQLFEIPEPPLPFCNHILKAWQSRLESHHNLNLTPASLELAVRLAHEKMPQERLPQSALTLLDLGAARKRWEDSKTRQELLRTERELRHLVEKRAELGEALSQTAKQTEPNTELRSEFEQVKQEILRTETRLQRFQQRLQDSARVLSGEDLMQAVEHPGLSS